MSTPIALPALLDEARFDALLLALYGPALMPAQRPVLVSQWSKYYFALVWRMLADGAPLSAFSHTTVMLDGRGLPLALGAEGAPCQGLQALLAEHLQPMVARLAQLGPVAVAVLWGNAGDCLDQALYGGAGHAGLQALLETPDSPLYAAVSQDAAGRRRRRTCCLSYKVDWVGHCEHCPLLS
ncbi:siderophore-iron reductase FhuF [Pseudomonas rubra]|uniref:Siderophore-iron reductase FhuF n=1 Tax=Pseudomonas rubra TaxID=2942627 RepID=A0ABT5P6I9_9PSED|nr:siderophore-iron reductase FhuF [Pseudomonas rubra]MDD1013654.1 siderophore-iron reductase FhuF [Pseudomonas rubra]MDD1040027.1 siderophore-iron reductase FhuF [Pseudomonas rubra]MDD1155967.1 siderophore-iron reductase FhuF [Pseudomonas rubra]